MSGMPCIFFLVIVFVTRLRAFVFVHCCHTHVTDKHCSMIGARGMALKKSGGINYVYRCLGQLLGYKIRQMTLKWANGFKTVQVSNRSVTYIRI